MKTDNHNEVLMALNANTEITRNLVEGATAMMDEVTAAMRRRAARLANRHVRRPRPTMPPPVATLLHGFSRAIAERIDTISARLPEEIRDRLRAVVPGFARSVLGNDADVVQLFGILLAATPDEAAHWLVEQVDLLEERFAS